MAGSFCSHSLSSSVVGLFFLGALLYYPLLITGITGVYVVREFSGVERSGIQQLHRSVLDCFRVHYRRHSLVLK